MCAFSPAFFSDLGWHVEEDNDEHRVQERRQVFGGSDGGLEMLPEDLPHDQSDPSSATTTRKQDHNASERTRRKRMNSLCSTLRSLLPARDQSSKKPSIPGTISQVLDYIPELQAEVNELVRKKEGLEVRVPGGRKKTHGRADKTKTPSHQVSVTEITDAEIMVQMSSIADHQSRVSEILRGSEEEGLGLMNTCHFVSSQGRAFLTLHFEVTATSKLDCEALKAKLLSLYHVDQASSSK